MKTMQWFFHECIAKVFDGNRTLKLDTVMFMSALGGVWSVAHRGLSIRAPLRYWISCVEAGRVEA